MAFFLKILRADNIILVKILGESLYPCGRPMNWYRMLLNLNLKNLLLSSLIFIEKYASLRSIDPKKQPSVIRLMASLRDSILKWILSNCLLNSFKFKIILVVPSFFNLPKILDTTWSLLSSTFSMTFLSKSLELLSQWLHACQAEI